MIWPVKIPAIVGASRLRLVTRRPLTTRLYISAVPPATSGMYWNDLCSARSFPNSSGRNGISDAAKSTWLMTKKFRPEVEPTPW